MPAGSSTELRILHFIPRRARRRLRTALTGRGRSGRCGQRVGDRHELDVKDECSSGGDDRWATALAVRELVGNQEAARAPPRACLQGPDPSRR